MTKKQMKKHLPLTLNKSSIKENEHKFSGVAITLGKPDNSHKIQFNINCFKAGTIKKTLLYHHKNGLDDVIGHVFLSYEKDDTKVTFEAVLNMELESAKKVWTMLTHDDLDSVSIGVDLSDYEMHTEGNYDDWYVEAKKAEIYELSVVIVGSDPKAKIRKVFSLEEFAGIDSQDEVPAEEPQEESKEESGETQFESNHEGETPTGVLSRDSKQKKEVANMGNKTTKNNLETLHGVRAERREQREAIELGKVTLAKMREQVLALSEKEDMESLERKTAELNKFDGDLKGMIEEDKHLEALEAKLSKRRQEIIDAADLVDPNAVDEKAELAIKKQKFAKMWQEKGYAFAAANTDDITKSEFAKDIIEEAFTHGGVLARSGKKYDSVKETKYKVYTSGRESNKGEYNDNTNTGGTSASIEVIKMQLGRYSTFVEITHDIRSGSEDDFYPWLVKEMADILQEDLETDQVSSVEAVTSTGERTGVYGIGSQMFVDKCLTTRVSYDANKPISSNILRLAAKVVNKNDTKLDVIINSDDYYAMIDTDMGRANAPLYSSIMSDFNFIPSTHVKSVTDATATPDDITLAVGILPNYIYGFEKQAIRFGETPQDKDLNSEVYGHAFASGMCTKKKSFAVSTGSAPGELTVGIDEESVSVGATTVTGTCTEGATVTTSVNGGIAIPATATGTTWSATVTALTVGDSVTATAALGGETETTPPVMVVSTLEMAEAKAKATAEAAKVAAEALKVAKEEEKKAGNNN